VSLGVLVVGQSERKAIPILLKKLGRTEKIHVRIVSQGEMLDSENIYNHINSLHYQDRRLMRVLIFLDAESSDPSSLQAQCSLKERELLQYDLRVQINYVVVDHSLEGWLACDYQAVQRVIGPGSRIKYRGNPEDHAKPAELLRQWFRAYGKDFRKTTHDPLLAEHADLGVIARKSPTFVYLRNTLGILA
jgi:hypothetical protein